MLQRNNRIAFIQFAALPAIACTLLLATIFAFTQLSTAWAGDHAATTPAAAEAPSQAAAIATPQMPAVEPNVRPKEPIPTSIFFSPEEQEQIRAALVAYEKSKLAPPEPENKGNDFLNQLTGTNREPEAPKAPEIKTFIYPQFFLNSLVYHTLDDWVVLINNQRFSAKEVQQNDELSIVGVNNEQVSVEWKPKNMQKVNESWAASQNDDAVVDKVRRVVDFTLKPNQTFSSYVMRVLEGKVRPVVVIVKQDDLSGATVTPAADGSAAEIKKPENITTDDIKNDVGVKGLDKTYKRMGLEN